MFPFISLLTNSTVWSMYGLLNSDLTIFVPNALGVLSGLFCVAVYQSITEEYTSKLHSGALFTMILAVTLAGNGNTMLLGLLGCGLSVIMMGAPLASLSSVIRDQSTASLPVTTTFAGLGNALSWSLYGILVANDPMVLAFQS